MKATLSADEAADKYGYPVTFFHWSLAASAA